MFEPWTRQRSSLLDQRLCLCRDKCSIKRSVLGPMCKLGNNVKIINCVLMDSVIVHDGCHLQNCIVCTGAELQARPTPYMALLVLKLMPFEQGKLRAASYLVMSACLAAGEALI